MAEEIIKRHCPVCREERDFRRVVEAHVEQERFSPHSPIGGPPPPTWIQRTQQPTAYCSVCRTVLYIGPSVEEVEQEFERERTGGQFYRKFVKEVNK